jgi:hypothetical protein
MSVESVRFLSTNAALPNPYSANWAAKSSSPVSLQPVEGARTANTGATDSAGVFLDATQKLSQQSGQQIEHKSKSTVLPAGSDPNTVASYTANSPVTAPLSTPVDTYTALSQRQVQNIATSMQTDGAQTRLPKANPSVNNSLNISPANTLPSQDTYSNVTFTTQHKIDNVTTPPAQLKSLDHNSVTDLSNTYSGYYKHGVDQTSFDLQNAKLKYLGQAQATNSVGNVVDTKA